MTANPENIFVGGQTCTLTAKVVDDSEVTYSDYNGQVRFIITGDTDSVNYDTSDIDASLGIATLDLTSTNDTGTIHITAETLDLDGEQVHTLSSITVDINVISIEVVENSIYYYDNNKIVKFNINLEGPEIILNDMKIEWGSSPTKLKKIEIKSPSTDDSYDPIIDVGNVSGPYTESDINTNLLPGESTIRLTFSKDMLNVPVTLTLYTDHGEFSVPIIE